MQEYIPLLFTLENVRKFVSDKDHNFVIVLVAYETKDNTMFPEIDLNISMIHPSSRKYWHYISQIAKLEQF